MTEDAPSTSHPGDELLRVAEAVHAGEVSVAFKPGPTVMAKVGNKLLDIAEASQVPIESGCDRANAVRLPPAAPRPSAACRVVPIATLRFYD